MSNGAYHVMNYMKLMNYVKRDMLRLCESSDWDIQGQGVAWHECCQKEKRKEN